MNIEPPTLPTQDPDALVRAITRTVAGLAEDAAAPSIGSESLSGRLPDAARLSDAAAQVALEHPEDADAARYFVALLEASYLVAGADGISSDEQTAIAELIAQVTGSRVSPERLTELLRAFESKVEQAGLGARIDAVAARFSDFIEREEALSFATLVAYADGKLAPPEVDALVCLGERFDFSKSEVGMVIDQVAQTIRSHLGS
jgi:tellurite resistance protein